MLEKLGMMTLNKDQDAPQTWDPKEVHSDPELLKLKEERSKIRKALQAEYGHVKDAPAWAREPYDAAEKRVRTLTERIKRQLLRDARESYFDGIDKAVLQHQWREEPEIEAESPKSLLECALPHRKRLSTLLLKDDPCDQDRIQALEELLLLCQSERVAKPTRKKDRPDQRLSTTRITRKSSPPISRPIPPGEISASKRTTPSSVTDARNTSPPRIQKRVVSPAPREKAQHVLVAMENLELRAQEVDLHCIFCLHAEDLPQHERTQTWPGQEFLYKHIRNQHLSKQESETIVCPYSFCSHVCSGARAFQRHAFVAHNLPV